MTTDVAQRPRTVGVVALPAAAVLGALCGILGVDGAGGGLAAVLGVAATACIGVVDARERRIPNAYVLPLAIFVTAVLLAAGIATGDVGRMLVAGASGIVALAAYTGLWALGGLGGGDARLAPVLIAHAAVYGLPAAAAAAAVPMALAMPHAIIAKRRGHDVPLGPYLAAGYAITLTIGLLAS